MGLIVENIPAGGVYVPVNVPVSGVHIPIASVTPANVPYVLTNNTSSELFTNENAFDTSIYRILSMQDDMKTVAIQGQVNSEFELFLKYAEEKTLGSNVGAGFDALDSYLGSLGV